MTMRRSAQLLRFTVQRYKNSYGVHIWLPFIGFFFIFWILYASMTVRYNVKGVHIKHTMSSARTRHQTVSRVKRGVSYPSFPVTWYISFETEFYRLPSASSLIRAGRGPECIKAFTLSAPADSPIT